MKLAPHPGVGSRDGCFNFLCAREQVWWVPGTLAHPCLPGGKTRSQQRASLAPGFQLSARAETAAVAEALARDQPHTLQPFLASCCTGALAAGVGIVRWWGKEQKPGEIVGRRDPNNVGGRSRSLTAD